MLNCKEVVRILGSGEELGLFQSLQLGLHRSMCKHCAAYRKQLAAMKSGFSKLFRDKTAVDSSVVQEVKSEIIRTISHSNKK